MENKLNLKKGDIIVVFNSSFIKKENRKVSTIDFFKIYHPLIISNEGSFMYVQYSSLVKVEIDKKVDLDWELDESALGDPCMWERSIYNSIESFLGYELVDKGQLKSYSYILSDENNAIWDSLVNLWKNEKNSNELIERTVKILDEDTNELGSFLRWYISL